ncbi:TPA: hypothetical protein DIT45_03155 [Candidatus Acetothermia bacterium]|nr:hypothetical protein [Candidatus Acetothermia bacterium]
MVNLIGKVIEELRSSIELFEAFRHEEGLMQLSSVVLEIDHYLKQSDDDLLLKLVPIDRASLGKRLKAVKGELVSVIENFSSTAP